MPTSPKKQDEQGGAARASSSKNKGSDDENSSPKNLYDLIMYSSFVKVFSLGIHDALSIHRCVPIFLTSEVVRYRTLQCVLLNGVIFLGSIFLYSFIISPLLELFLRRGVEDPEAYGMYHDLVLSLFAIFYRLFYLYPIYILSFILNTVGYQDIADNVAQRYGDVAKRMDLQDRLVDEIFRLLLTLVYISSMTLVFYIPQVGQPLSFALLCWLASLYCFEYRWVNLGWDSAQRISYFERHWAYFLGFGFPLASLTFFAPKFVDNGIFALVFPVFIITSTCGRPQELKTQNFRSLPVFFFQKKITQILLYCIEGKLFRKKR